MRLKCKYRRYNVDTWLNIVWSTNNIPNNVTVESPKLYKKNYISVREEKYFYSLNRVRKAYTCKLYGAIDGTKTNILK